MSQKFMKNDFNSKQLLESLTFCVLDLETTGGNPDTEQIIEIGMVKIEKMKLTEERSFLINPEKPIPEFVQKLTGIKNEDVLSSPKIHEVLDDVIQFIGDSILVAHNISFDIPFLNGTLKKYHRMTIENNVLCTNIMTKYLIPEIVSTNLNFMSQMFKLKHSKAHRAIEDARATAELLLTYLKIFEEKKIWKVNQIYYPRNRFEIDRLQFEAPKDSMQNVIDFLAKEKRPILLTVKGENGVIQAILPIENPSESLEKLKTFLVPMKWSMITLKLIGPLTEGFIQISEQFLKMPDLYRKQVLDYLIDSHQDEFIDQEFRMQDYFLITPHLIQGQYIIYPLMSPRHNSHLVFKYPAHKKKLLQFSTNHCQRSEESSKKDFSYLTKEIRPIFYNFLKKSFLKKENEYLFCHKDILKSNQKQFFDQIDLISKKEINRYSFPKDHF